MKTERAAKPFDVVALATPYGIQAIIIDAENRALAETASCIFEGGRLKVKVRVGRDSVSLARVVAEARVKRPTPAHDVVMFRNGSGLDCRACNLYWATYSEARSRTASFLKRMAFQAPARKKPAPADVS